MISEAFMVSFAAALFSMLNPIGAVGIFASMTSLKTDEEAKAIAMKCALTVAIALLVVNWAGTHILHFFGISIATLQAAGGIVVLLIGLNMLFNKTGHKTSEAEIVDSQHKESIAVVPLAIPLVAGPGSMATVLLASGRDNNLFLKLQISVVILALALVCGIIFYFARPLSKFIGESGMGVMTRMMGLILAAIAMGLFAEGLKSLFPGLAG